MLAPPLSFRDNYTSYSEVKERRVHQLNGVIVTRSNLVFERRGFEDRKSFTFIFRDIYKRYNREKS